MDLIIAPTLGSLVLILIFSIPLLGQGGFATEHRQGRLTMWLSSPRGSMELVLGRVFGLFLSGLPLLVSSGLTVAAIGFGVEFDWLRFITALGADTVFTALAGGPSGNRFSRWYKTDVERWLRGEYKRIDLASDD